MAHTPTLPGEDAPIQPDHQEGAFTNCTCADCMEARLVDNDRITYTAHDMADAWTDGYKTGYARAETRLAGVGG